MTIFNLFFSKFGLNHGEILDTEQNKIIRGLWNFNGCKVTKLDPDTQIRPNDGDVYFTLNSRVDGWGVVCQRSVLSECFASSF